MSGRTHAASHKTPRTRICTWGHSNQALGGVSIPTVEGLLGRSFSGLRNNQDVPANWSNINAHINAYNAGYTQNYRSNQIRTAGGWAEVIAGTHDAVLTSFAANIQAQPLKWNPSNPFIVCFHHETSLDMNGGSSGVNAGTAAEFQAAFRYVRNFWDAMGATVFKASGQYQGGPIKMAYVGWDRMFVGANGIGPPTAGQGYDDFDPGTAYYEYVGTDVYNPIDSPGVLRYGTDAGTLLNAVVTAAVSRNKDWICGEMGCNDAATAQDHTNKAAWLDSFRQLILSRGAHKPGVCRAVYCTVKASVENYNVDSSAESLSAFQRLAASTYFK